jgi:hypothetical protein
MSLVEVDTPLHNALDVGSCGTLLGLYLIQILLYLILHLCIHLNILVVHCTEVRDCIAWGYTVVAHCCIGDAHYCTDVAHCYMVVVPSLTKVHLVLSSFILAPYKYLKLFLSLAPLSYNLYHHDLLTCKKCSMNFWVLCYTSASLDNDMDHDHVFYKSHTMVLLLAKGLVLMFPCTTRKLDIHSCGVLLSCMWYTKQLLFFFCPYSG